MADRNMGAAPTMHDIGAAVRDLHDNLVSFRKRNDERIDDLDREMRGLNERNAFASRSHGSDTGGVSAASRRDFIAALRGDIRASMTTDDNQAGGIVVPDDLERSIYRAARDISPMRRLATTVSIRGAAYMRPILAEGVNCDWVGERGSRPETSGFKLGMLRIPANELYSMPAVTQQLLDDADPDVSSELEGEIAFAMTAKEGEAFIRGSGVGQPMGLLSYPTVAQDSWSYGKLGFVKTGAPSGFDATNPADALIDLVYSLKAEYRKKGTWLMSTATVAKARKWKDLEGRYIWQAPISAGEPATLLGYPVEIDENMDAVEAGKFPIAFGDFARCYYVIDRKGITMLRDPYSAKPYILFYTVKRVGGGVVDFDAVKLLKVSS